MSMKIYRLDSHKTSLVFSGDGQNVYYLYYGKKIGEISPETYFLKEDNISTDLRNKLFSCYGDYDHRDKSILLFNPDNSFANDFVFKSATLMKGKKAIPCLPSSFGAEKTLTFEFEDKHEKLLLTVSYSVYRDSDVITVRSSLKNLNEKTVTIKKFSSLQLDISESGFTASTFDGFWGGERYRHDTPLSSGVFINQSLAGVSSSQHNPFSLIKNDKGVYGFNLVYSGSHKTSYETDACNRTRIITGINDTAFEYKLNPEETFYAPEAVMVYAVNEDELTLNLHSFINKHIIPKRWQNKKRPIVINNWEGTQFNFTRDKILDIARNGKKIGAELFVLDDGWFGKRNNDDCSLGDWYLNKEKLPAGLASLAEKINGMGMKFGLWVEPEMISPDSDLYRAHPDWCLHAEGRTRTQNRQQLVLDYTRKDVRDYIIDAIGSVIASANIEYIKWDCNRNLTEMQNQMQAHEYVLGLYEVLEALTSRFPHVLFEGCSGGGGRFDAGMMYYMPQTWTSDNTDPMARIKIQYGTSMVFPPIAMTAHVGSIDVGYERENAKMNTCAMVAMSGNFGYELDLSKLSETEIKQAKGYADLYKEIRKTIQFGDFYRLENPYESDVCSFEFVDDTRVVLFTYQTFCKINGEERRVKFKGLDKDAKYDDNGTIRTGEELMKLGRRIEIFSREQTSRCYIFNRIAE